MHLPPAPIDRPKLSQGLTRSALVGCLVLSGLIAKAQTPSPMKQGAELSWLPGWSQVRLRMLEAEKQRPTQFQVQTISEQPAARFIVRLRGDPVLDGIAKNYRRDQAAAQARFENWCRRHDGLQGLLLLGASYSGELVVGLPQNDPYRRTPAEILAVFETMDNLVYAELDAVAHPSEGGN